MATKVQKIFLTAWLRMMKHGFIISTWRKRSRVVETSKLSDTASFDTFEQIEKIHLSIFGMLKEDVNMIDTWKRKP